MEQTPHFYHIQEQVVEAVEIGLMEQVKQVVAVVGGLVKEVPVQRVHKASVEQMEEVNLHAVEVVEVWDKQENSQQMEVPVQVEMVCNIQ
jgi:predicted ABC-type ATPase